MSWCHDYRMNWIAEMLRVYGFINRGHLKRMFGISEPQASNDLGAFMRERPGLMEYNATAKRFEGLSK